MKLIKGSTLETILKHRSDSVAERGRLLAVFEAVCQAVGYAHAHQVIHRDLKPANIMVGAFGEVQVMDWGLAKVLSQETRGTAEEAAAEQTVAWTQVSPAPEAGSYTQAGSLVGTPAYIPPEQAAGEIQRVDERVDVFGLGAVLTAILTGKPPYVGETAESVRLLAVRGKLDDCFNRLNTCEAEPELIALCKRCLAFEPTDRPANGGEVAEEVARLRSAAEGRALKAERDKAAADARAEEQLRKRRWQYTAAGAVVLALAGGILGLGLYLREQARANADLEAKNTELAVANEGERQRFSLAVDAIGLLTGNIGQDLLLQQKEFEQLRTRLLQGAADFYGKLESQLKDRHDPASRAALGRAYFELGELTGKIGSKEEALAVHRKALAIRQELAAVAGAEPETRLDVARSLGSVGWLLVENGDPSAGLNAFEAQRDVAMALESESPKEAVQIVLARAYVGIGNVFYNAGKEADGLAMYEKARQLQQTLSEDYSTKTQIQSDLAKIHGYISGALLQMGKSAESLASVQAARAVQQKLADADPTSTEFQSELAKSYYAIGFHQYRLGKTADGLVSVQTSLTIIQNLCRDHPASTEFEFRLALCHQIIGEMLYNTPGKLSDGLASARSAQSLLQKLADDHPSVPKYRSELIFCRTLEADTLRRMGRLDEARASCLAAIVDAEVLVRDMPTIKDRRVYLAWSQRVLGMIRLGDGDVAQATNDIRRALELFDGLSIRSGELWFETACCHAMLSALAGAEGSGVPIADKPVEAGKALVMLKKALDLGYRAETFRTESALDSLRESDDFQRLMAEIDALNKAEEDRDAGMK
jgi:tetratricopeptide (TPR) repeat protein